MPLSKDKQAAWMREHRAKKKAEKEAQEKAAGKAEEERKEARARITRAYREKGLADGSEPDRVKVFPMEAKGMVEYMKYIEERGKTLELVYVDWVTGEILSAPVYQMVDSPMQKQMNEEREWRTLHEAEHELREAVERYEGSERRSE